MIGSDCKIGIVVWNVTCYSNQPRCDVTSQSFLEGENFNKLAIIDVANNPERVIFVSVTYPLEVQEIVFPTLKGPYI